MTLRQSLAKATGQLEAAGISADEAAIDVNLYARTILGWDDAQLIAEWSSTVPRALEPRFSEYVARREQREPTAYIVGYKEFWGLKFLVSSAVLIPRPESELIIEEALATIKTNRSVSVADIGTGSGCLAISIAYERPLAQLIATDISKDALDVGRKNAKNHNVLNRTDFKATSYLDGIAGPFEVIVANPPYVMDIAKSALPRQVAGYEPHVALFGGKDGLRDIKGVIKAASQTLVPNGHLIFEFGLGQDDLVCELVDQYPHFSIEKIRKDFQDIPRIAVLQKH